MRDDSYHGIVNPSCPACTGALEISPLSAIPGKGRFSDSRYVEQFGFNREQKPNWKLLLFFHGRQDMTRVIRIRVLTNGVDYPRTDAGRKPSLRLQYAVAEESRDLVPGHEQIGRILGVLPNPNALPEELVPEIRTDRFLMMGCRRNGDDFTILLPLVHIVQSYEG